MGCRHRTKIPIHIGESDNVRKVCDDISKRDRDFRYMIVALYDGMDTVKFEAVLVIRSCTEEMAHKRGGWFIHKCTDAKFADYYWVK